MRVHPGGGRVGAGGRPVVGNTRHATRATLPKRVSLPRGAIVLRRTLFCITLLLVSSAEAGPPRHADYEPGNPARLTETELAAWAAIEPPVQIGFGSVDRRYDHHLPPHGLSAGPWRVAAWRGERVHTQVVVAARDSLTQLRCLPSAFVSSEAHEIGRDSVRARFVRGVLAEPPNVQGCGELKTADRLLFPDVLDDAERIGLQGQTTRAIWITIDVPRDAAPGRYEGSVLVQAAELEPTRLPVVLTVLPLELPEPGQWSFHLDLWQNPWAIARYHGVEPWSEAHMMVMRPYLEMLADAGQKYVTTTMYPETWRGQTYDPYGGMIEWIRRADGSLGWDYGTFDAYVEFAASCGLDGTINCYSLAAWNANIRVSDEVTGEHEWINAAVASESYEEAFEPFLRDFVAHLEEQGWLDRVQIAVDEIGPDKMKHVVPFLRRVAPELRLHLAGNLHGEYVEWLDDYCILIGQTPEESLGAARRSSGGVTTFYVCCTPPRPNVFTWSPPAEGAYLGWFALAHDYDGFLRWAAFSWPEDPLVDSCHTTWPGGDTFVIYPGPRSSIRFERLREGIQDYEKSRIIRPLLRELGTPHADAALRALDRAIEQCRTHALDADYARRVNEAKAALVAASRILGQEWAEWPR
jgi:hypothetical protein